MDAAENEGRPAPQWRAGHLWIWGCASAHLPVLQPLCTRPQGARITDLAAWAHITKPSLVYPVNHLEAHGIVERTADPVDGRAQRVRSTERGLAVIRCVQVLVRQTEADWEGRIGAAALAHLKRISSASQAHLAQPDRFAGGA